MQVVSIWVPNLAYAMGTLGLARPIQGLVSNTDCN